jgi:hypothetical protein
MCTPLQIKAEITKIISSSGNKRLLPVFSAGGSPPSKRARKDTGDPPKDKPAIPDGDFTCLYV